MKNSNTSGPALLTVGRFEYLAVVRGFGGGGPLRVFRGTEGPPAAENPQSRPPPRRRNAAEDPKADCCRVSKEKN